MLKFEVKQSLNLVGD